MVFERDIFLPGLVKFAGKKWTGQTLVGNPISYKKVLVQKLTGKEMEGPEQSPFLSVSESGQPCGCRKLSDNSCFFPEWP